MTYPGTWKTVLILSRGLNTSRTLFLVLTNVSFWDVNPAAEQTSLKDLDLVSGRWVLCFKGISWLSSSGLYVSSPATTVMSLCSESELYSMLLSSLGTRSSEPWGIGLMAEGASSIGHDACSCYLFFLHLTCRNSNP